MTVPTETVSLFSLPINVPLGSALLPWELSLRAYCKPAIKAGFHMIADRRSQIAIRSAIVCDHMETTSVVFYLKAGFHMIADDRRPYCDLRSAIRDHMETSLKG